MKGFLGSFYRHFQQGTPTRNILVFISGSAAAFVIGAVFTPVITRIYLPEDYGQFAFFNTLASIFVAISSIGFTEALVLPKQMKGFINLARIIIMVSVSLSLFLFLLLLLFGSTFLEYFNVPGLGYWILLLPVIIVFTSYQQIADSYNIRKKKFGVNSRSRIVSVTLGKTSVSAIGFGFGSFAGGLIIGELIIRMVNYFMLMGRQSFTFLKRTFVRFRWAGLKGTAMTFKNYPLFIFPSSILIQVAIQIPVFFVSKMYEADHLGYYALAISLLGIPVQVIAFSMGKVFLQQANELASKPDELRAMIRKVYYSLIIVASAGYGLVFVKGPALFEWFAGTDWVLSGQIASMMCFALIFQLTGIALGPTFRVLGRERLQFTMNVTGSVIMIFGLLFSVFYDVTFFDFVYLAASLIATRFILVLVGILYAAKLNVVKHMAGGLIIIALVFMVYYQGVQFLQYLSD